MIEVSCYGQLDGMAVLLPKIILDFKITYQQPSQQQSPTSNFPPTRYSVLCTFVYNLSLSDYVTIKHYSSLQKFLPLNELRPSSPSSLPNDGARGGASSAKPKMKMLYDLSEGDASREFHVDEYMCRKTSIPSGAMPTGAPSRVTVVPGAGGRSYQPQGASSTFSSRVETKCICRVELPLKDERGNKGIMLYNLTIDEDALANFHKLKKLFHDSLNDLFATFIGKHEYRIYVKQGRLSYNLSCDERKTAFTEGLPTILALLSGEKLPERSNLSSLLNKVPTMKASLSLSLNFKQAQAGPSTLEVLFDNYDQLALIEFYLSFIENTITGISSFVFTDSSLSIRIGSDQCIYTYKLPDQTAKFVHDLSEIVSKLKAYYDKNWRTPESWLLKDKIAHKAEQVQADQEFAERLEKEERERARQERADQEFAERLEKEERERAERLEKEERERAERAWGERAQREGARGEGARGEGAQRVGTTELQKYLKVLGLENQELTQQGLRKEYLKLMRKHHPDKRGNAETAKKINEAYDGIQKLKGWFL